VADRTANKSTSGWAYHFIDLYGRDYMRRWRFEAHITPAGLPRRWAASTVMPSNAIASNIHLLVL
jgi:hypothetical protein